MRAAIVCFSLAALAAPASAQTAAPAPLALRPFALLAGQQFTASDTFDATFGSSRQIFFGGGLSVTQDDEVYLDLAVSRFRKTGERAFVADGRAFPLGIPLTATITPFEMTAGYRFHRRPRAIPGRRLPPRRPSRVIPYVGGGVGLYRYTETSPFAEEGDDVDTQHVGAIGEGGVEIRLGRYLAVAGDVHYTYVPGILGSGGISQQVGDNDLGGISVRAKVVVGR